MPTTLTKPVTRQIGQLVVTITADAIELRKCRGRRRIRHSWAELMTLGTTWDTARAAFAQHCSRGWMPKPGDRVWCYPNRRGIVTRIVESMPEPIVFVRIKAGRGSVVRQFHRSKTRPARPIKGRE